ncbi:MAG: citrate synthase [Candidatus Fraserbacteria bacterium RBG_16_55_9]|uniref:Citrate synthase n=1 Tax=Fraserbacteria sp. (strain RBG_16_55_9) TaxID=1817864 RepID=A0A1F5V2S0_FRAXR|nr:MAG: citrate synthase [Candidatus Fraserbacteria bacterium RBG_16_55_9]
MTELHAGLKGVVIGQSTICFIDGERGLLRYRGYDIEDLAKYSTYEETAYLLTYGKLPTHGELRQFSQALKEHRTLSGTELEILHALPKEAPPMDVLRSLVSVSALFDPEADDPAERANQNKVFKLIAKIPTILAAYDRVRRNVKPVAPHRSLGHAVNFLYMLSGEEPNETSARVFDVCLILHAEHGFNASTFAARVTASTLSDLYSSVTAAIGTLKGLLHGGANAQVLEMLQAIDSVKNVRSHIEGMIARKEKVWGMGHRVYKTKDPRAYILQGLIEQLASVSGQDPLYNIAREVEKVSIELLGKKGIYPNVDFYTAVAYHMLGIPLDLFTPIFALSRVSGWTAHVLEQYRHNALIRPQEQYVGPGERTYTPIDQRTRKDER